VGVLVPVLLDVADYRSFEASWWVGGRCRYVQVDILWFYECLCIDVTLFVD
jgi:hypothetical protein